jgi:hypothetical protein
MLDDASSSSLIVKIGDLGGGKVVVCLVEILTHCLKSQTAMRKNDFSSPLMTPLGLRASKGVTQYHISFCLNSNTSFLSLFYLV